MTSTVIIRQEQPLDYRQVEEVVRQAFESAEQSDHMEHQLVARLRQSDAFVPELSLVAEDEEGRIVGHILLTEIKVHDNVLLSLAPLSVLPSYQRQGVGGRLINEAHRIATQMDYKGIAVLGHEHYYPQFGYEPASRYGIRFPFVAPDECCMLKVLTAEWDNSIAGTIEYPKEFGI